MSNSLPHGKMTIISKNINFIFHKDTNDISTNNRYLFHHRDFSDTNQVSLILLFYFTELHVSQFAVSWKLKFQFAWLFMQWPIIVKSLFKSYLMNVNGILYALSISNNIKFFVDIFKLRSTLVRIMADDVRNQAITWTNVYWYLCHHIWHYLNQCWLRSMSLYGITRPQWVKTAR